MSEIEEVREAEPVVLWTHTIQTENFHFRFTMEKAYDSFAWVYRYTAHLIEVTGKTKLKETELETLMDIPLLFKPIKKAVKKGDRLFARFYELKEATEEKEEKDSKKK